MTVERIEDGKYIFADGRGRVTVEDGNHWSLVEQGVKADWDEEDGRKFERVLWHLRYSVNNGDTDHSAGQLEGWFVSLRDRIDPESHWTEEDVDMFGSILSTLGICMNNPDIPEDVRKMHRKEYNWFNELYNRVLPTGRGEWSEEDEHMLSRCIRIISCCKTGNYPEEISDAELDWLKSLKQRDIKLPTREAKNVTEMCEKYSALTSDKSHYKSIIKEGIQYQPWKPSEEQIGALEHVINFLKGSITSGILESLYNDIKKLRYDND